MELENIPPADLVILEIIIQWVLKFSQFLIFFGFFFFFPISQSGFSIIILKGLWVGKWIICEFKWISSKSKLNWACGYTSKLSKASTKMLEISVCLTHIHIWCLHIFLNSICAWNSPSRPPPISKQHGSNGRSP